MWFRSLTEIVNTAETTLPTSLSLLSISKPCHCFFLLCFFTRKIYFLRLFTNRVFTRTSEYPSSHCLEVHMQTAIVIYTVHFILSRTLFTHL